MGSRKDTYDQVGKGVLEHLKRITVGLDREMRSAHLEIEVEIESDVLRPKSENEPIGMRPIMPNSGNVGPMGYGMSSLAKLQGMTRKAIQPKAQPFPLKADKDDPTWENQTPQNQKKIMEIAQEKAREKATEFLMRLLKR